MAYLVRLDDESEMPWGKYKGEQMINVPDDYLIYIYKRGTLCRQVKEYIEDCFNEKDLR